MNPILVKIFGDFKKKEKLFFLHTGPSAAQMTVVVRVELELDGVYKKIK